jgi:hypothetical protein
MYGKKMPLLYLDEKQTNYWALQQPTSIIVIIIMVVVEAGLHTYAFGELGSVLFSYLRFSILKSLFQ